MIKKREIPDLNSIAPIYSTEWLFRLKEPKHLLSDISISNKNFYDWRKQEVVPPTQFKTDSETYKELRFSYFETIWLMMVKDLRQMGVSYNSIRNIKNEFWSEIPPELIDNLICSDLNKNDKKIKFSKADIQKRLVEYVQSKNLKLEKSRLDTYWFEEIVYSTLSLRNDSKILYRYDGGVSIFNNSPTIKFESEAKSFSVQEDYIKDYSPFPHIIIPIEKYIIDYFISDDKPGNLKVFNFVNDDELEIMNVVRLGNLKEITVMLNKKMNAIKFYEFKKEEVLSREDFYQLMRILFLKEYENITFKWKNNKIVYFEKTRNGNLLFPEQPL